MKATRGTGTTIWWVNAILISSQILTSFVSCEKRFKDCKVHGIFVDVTIYAGMKAGLYIPYDNPNDLAQMTVTKCTEYCCKKRDITDMVFVLNKYCYCVSCYSVKLCRLFSINPPKGFHPVAVILNKDIATLVSPTTSQRGLILPSGKVFTKQPLTTKLSSVRSTLSTHHVRNATAGLGREREEKGQTSTNKASLAVKNVYLPSSPNGGSESRSGNTQNGKTGIDNFTKFQPLTPAKSVTLPPTPVPTPLRTTLGPTKLAIKERTVEGKGNDDISIQCQGTLKITRVLAFGIVGDAKTVTDFDKYCQANIKEVDNTKVCVISLKRVYKTNYPPFISTKVTYKCTYYTRST